MWTNLMEVQEKIEKDDVINDVDTVTRKSTSLIYTTGPTYLTIGGSRGKYNYQRVKKVTRKSEVTGEFEDMYICKHGGIRAGGFGDDNGKYTKHGGMRVSPKWSF